MSRICGITSPNLNKDAVRPILHKMTRLMQHEDWHRIDEWSDNRIGLGHTSIGAVNEEPQPISNEDGSKIVISAGKIVAYEDRKKDLINKGHIFRYPNNDAEFVLYLYEEYGVRRFRELNGIFAFSIWDKTKNELILVNDRYGLRPLYYYFDENRRTFIFASEVKAISKQDFFDKKVNWDAWNVFIRLGLLIGCDTFFKNISTLPHGSVLRFNLDKISIENYWNYDELKMKSSFDKEEDVDNLIYLFKQSMKRRIIPDKKAIVFLSGGLDSRGIAAELKHQGASFTTYTTRKFNPVDNDRKLAVKVADRLGVKNIYCNLPEDFLDREYSYRNTLLDYESDESAWMLPLLEILPPDTKINYDGCGQDLFCDPLLYQDANLHYFNMMESGKYDEFIERWFYQKQFSFLRWPIGKDKNNFIFFSKKMRRNFSNEAFLAKVKKEFMRCKGDNRYLFFHLLSRGNREVNLAPYQLVLNKAESFCPYFDNDYLEYVMSLPIMGKWNRFLRKAMLDRAYPELSQIDAILCYKKDYSYAEDHEEFYSQRLKNLSRIERRLLTRMKFGVYNLSYVLPRIIHNLLIINFSSINRLEVSKKIYDRCHFRLFPALDFLNNWLLHEGITSENMNLNGVQIRI